MKGLLLLPYLETERISSEKFFRKWKCWLDCEESQLQWMWLMGEFVECLPTFPSSVCLSVIWAPAGGSEIQVWVWVGVHCPQVHAHSPMSMSESQVQGLSVCAHAQVRVQLKWTLVQLLVQVLTWVLKTGNRSNSHFVHVSMNCESVDVVYV